MLVGGDEESSAGIPRDSLRCDEDNRTIRGTLGENAVRNDGEKAMALAVSHSSSRKSSRSMVVVKE